MRLFSQSFMYWSYEIGPKGVGIKYVLKSFRMTTKINGLVMVEDATNGVFTQQMRSMIKKVKSGGTIVFKEIQAQLFDDT